MTNRSEQLPPPQGRFAGLPWDWRRPTGERLASRAWNPNDHRLFTPKAFGWRYGLNFYWITHPRRFLRARAARRHE